MDRQTDITSYRVTCTRLKKIAKSLNYFVCGPWCQWSDQKYFCILTHPNIPFVTFLTDFDWQAQSHAHAQTPTVMIFRFACTNYERRSYDSWSILMYDISRILTSHARWYVSHLWQSSASAHGRMIRHTDTDTHTRARTRTHACTYTHTRMHAHARTHRTRSS